MNISRVLGLGFLLACLAIGAFGQEKALLTRAAASKLMADGNFKEAYDAFRARALDPKTPADDVAFDLADGVQCLNNLGRIVEFDEFVESTITAHKDQWQVLAKAALLYVGGSVQNQGSLIAGKFERGPHRGGMAKYVSCFERDRVRAMQLLLSAIQLAQESKLTLPSQRAQIHWQLAETLYSTRGYRASWQLQDLTDLSTLPDYEEGWYGWGYRGGNQRGAPVDANGDPVYYRVPESWEKAQNDGERWRWAMEQCATLDPSRRPDVNFTFASFLRDQFDVQTVAQLPWFWRTLADEDTKDTAAAGYQVNTLGEDETLARLANGVKRFKLPDEFNFIRIFRALSDDNKAHAEDSSNALAEIFSNRRQYDKAADMWRRSIKMSRQDWKQDRLDQIVGNWGTFEQAGTQPAGGDTSVEFRFRNGKAAHFEAYELKQELLLNDVKEYLRSSPRNLEWDKLNIGDIGWRIVHENQTKYVGEQVAMWEQTLEPAANHFDKRITVHVPIKKAGAYLLVGRLENGNISRIVLWIADSAIVQKPIVNGTYCFIADAVSGAPIPAAKVEFFGYRTEFVDERPTGRGYQRVITTSFDATADNDGQVIAKKPDENFQWLITATAPDGRLAWLGFTYIWSPRTDQADYEYSQQRAFVITDRPVYRPKQKVHFKIWISQAQYDKEGPSSFAGRGVTIEVRDPRNEKVYDKHLIADQYGGVDGEFDLADQATLGVYGVNVVGVGGSTFRVEEYKKPEFEVTVSAPEKPIMLGEKFDAKVTAKYYFGAPVTQGKAKIKVMRTSYTQRWYPIGPWDWLYGPGYCWLMMDCAWYPGWSSWGCPRPIMEWWPVRQEPPELVAELEVPLAEDGTASVPIDTAVAKAVLGDVDHRYEITAEVTDQSRRTIVGSGSVIAARKPFTVTAWTHRGFYRVGDTIQATYAARTPDFKPLKATGMMKLLRIVYDSKGNPTETEVQRWKAETDVEGNASQQMKASKAGQYRLSVSLKDSAGHEIEGACLITVVGEGIAGKNFRFNDITLTPDRSEYAAGDKMNVMVSVARHGSTVLFFERPVNGAYKPPRVIRMTGEASLETMQIAKADMPNTFVEALTVADGKVFSDVREIAVPPESRILNLEVKPDKAEYKPGEKADVTLKVTGLDGKPVVGSVVLSIYDKSVEYITGDANIGYMKKFFWGWRRHHHPQTQSSLDRRGGNLLKRDEKGLQPIGVFGNVVNDTTVTAYDNEVYFTNGASGRSARMMKGAMVADGSSYAYDAAAPAAAEPRLALREALVFEDARKTTSGGEMGGAQPTVEPTIRKEFADTALWLGSITTDADGIAKTTLTMPENLTTWRAHAWAMGFGAKVGETSAEVVTTKNIIVRLQAPRFLVQKDEFTLSANIHNYLKTEKTIKVSLQLEGGCLESMAGQPPVYNVTLPSNGESRVDWRVRATAEGEATIRVKAITDEESDAVEETRPILVHGMLKTESWSGAIRPDRNSATVTVKVPEERRPEQTRLEVRYSPSLAMAMVDALPYLADYPYGCTEQTLNRFLPAVITRNTLRRMGLDLADIAKKRANLNAQEIGDAAERAKRWKRFDRNPVFDEAELDAMVRAGIQRLSDMQCSDGGWGWFSGWGEYSWPHTTALVVHGLQVAKQTGEAVPQDMLDRGIGWLGVYQQDQLKRLRNAPDKIEPYKDYADNMDAMVYMVLNDAGQDEPAMRDFLYRDRNYLSVYAKAMLGLALHKVGDTEKRDMLLRNLEQYLVRDDENQTAWLRMPEGNVWWCWYGSETEAHAFYLKLLARTDPKGETAARLAKYVINNRKHATYWDSTRDTALCIEALSDFIKASGEEQPDMKLQVLVDGKLQKEVSINKDNLFSYDNALILEGDKVATGEHKIEIRRDGKGPVYFNVYLTNFTLEDPITKAGLEIKVDRTAYKLTPVEKKISAQGERGQVLKQRVEKYERTPISDLKSLKSGDLVEVEMVVESKNDYEYIILEDWKAAGFETVDVRSGYTGNELGAYVEFRDQRTVFFVRMLPRGRHSVTYRLRAETPGVFSALPATGTGMYAPELRANSDEYKAKITD